MNPVEVPPLLRLDGLGLSHGESRERLFSGLSLAIAPESAIVLQGPSGVGKSSLLRCIAGLEARAQGTLYFAGNPVAAREVPTFRTQAIYVPQSPPRMPMRVEDSLRYAFGFRHQALHYNADLARALCKELLLPEALLDQELADLSGGEAQRFGVLRALLLQPRLLLLDEPASSLDAESRAAMAKALESWFREGQRSLVVCSHEPRWCDAILTETWSLASGGTLAVGRSVA